MNGGTDGSRLTEMGVPTPNLFTGMQEIHGPLEWVSIQDMARATEMCIELARQWSSAHQEAHTRPAAHEPVAQLDQASLVDWTG